MGLSIVRRLAQLMGGEAGVERALGILSGEIYVSERIANRMVLGILAAAFVVALAVLLSAYHVRSDPQTAAILIVGFVLASVLGVYVAWSILRSGRP